MLAKFPERRLTTLLCAHQHAGAPPPPPRHLPVRPWHDAEGTAAFSSINQVDVNNTQLMAAMHAHFRRNALVIGWWLQHCVLKRDTKQYLGRLVASAWDLANNPTGLVAGFSGTNDTHRLLPEQVEQVTLDAAPELAGTNGKMLGMLLQYSQYTTLQVGPGPADGNQVRARQLAAIWCCCRGCWRVAGRTV